jgi:hypothetical protein
LTLRERLGCAALASLALHGLVLSGAWVPVPQAPDDQRPLPLAARLAPPELKPAPPQVNPAAPRAQPSRPATPPRAPARAAPSTAPAPAPESVAPANPGFVEAPPAPAVTPETEPPQQLAHAAESTAAIPRSLPRRGRITYSLTYGEARTYVGKVVQSWEVENDVYRLSSEAETAGLVDLIRPQRMHYLSQGRVTREGLRPDSFLMSRTRRGRTEAAQARFDWQAGTLAYGLAREPKSAPLPHGAHDFLSFIFQHALLPPAPGRYRIPITTGPRFETHDIEVGSEEAIETPIGALRALPVRQVPRPGSESIQLWLAAEYRYLPVRIRHYDREGNFSGEQAVNEIRISDQ